MLVPGHLATAVLAAVVVAQLRRRGGAAPGSQRSARADAPRSARASARHPGSVRWMLLPAALGALTPDLLDKSRLALGGSIYGRTIGHSLLFLVAITAVWVGWMLLRRRRLASVDADPAARGSAASASPSASPSASLSASLSASPSASPSASLSASLSPGLSTAFGFWVLGVASHAVADLADDALRGLLRGGMVTSSWFAWPWATPYTHVFRVQEPRLTSEWVARLDAVPGGTSPLEAVVLLAAGVWVVVWVMGRVARRTGANGPQT